MDNNSYEFSVLMSVYIKEKPSNIIDCFESLLNQTLQANQWIVVKDGPLTEEQNMIIDDYSNKNKGLIKIVTIDENVGLGIALQKGIMASDYELVARMDTDDIAINDRFELQINEFKNNKNLDICGGQIYEFSGSVNNVISKRNVPLEQCEMIAFHKYRNTFNHMTVMFKKSAVISAGNYQHRPLVEDYDLWARMIMNKSNIKNLKEYLVYARTGEDMIKRRGGLSYLIKYVKAKKGLLDIGFLNKTEFCYTVLAQSLFALVPSNVRAILYKKTLRK